MKEAWWRTFGHILQLPISTAGQQAMNYYFQCPTNEKILRKEMNTTAK